MNGRIDRFERRWPVPLGEGLNPLIASHGRGRRRSLNARRVDGCSAHMNLLVLEALSAPEAAFDRFLARGGSRPQPSHPIEKAVPSSALASRHDPAVDPAR
jgi:hypothetical protein